MKKFFYLLPALALVFSACSDDDDNDDDGIIKNKIEVKAGDIKDAPATTGVDAVKLVSYNEITEAETVLATTSWNNGFNIELPEIFASSALYTVHDFFYEDWDEDELEELNVSNMSAKICQAYLEAYKGNEFIGTIIMSDNSNTTFVNYWYADSDVAIKGTLRYDWTSDGKDYAEIVNYDMNLKKGWNSVAQINSEKGNDTITDIKTSIPNGMSWWFFSDDEF